MRLIDADIVLDACKHQREKYAPGTAGYRTADGILRYIEKRVRLSEKHALWKKVDDSINLWECSVCGRIIICGSPDLCEENFCACCGAKMDKEGA